MEREDSPVADGGQVSFGTVLRRFRLAADLSQEALAERARMSVDAISALERGARRAPQRQTLVLLINALKLTAEARAELEAAAIRRHRPRGQAEVSYLTDVQQPDNFPSPLTSFLGRERDIETIVKLLEDHRLVTLVGPGGVGKSRLAVETARRTRSRLRYDGRLVELASLSDGLVAIPKVLQTLGIPEQPPTPPLETLIAVLRTSQRFLVLDNCEHLAESLAEQLSTLLARCPSLRVVATSREPLRIPGETLYHVEPLPPAAAVQLFIDRAKAARPDFDARTEDADAIDTICSRLDGIPLAIELAATRIEALNVRAIARRIEQRFSLLTTGPRSGLVRHRTLRSLIDWSYEQLSAREKDLFRRLAIFRGSWHLEAAEAVAVGPGLAAGDVLSIISDLLAKSLVTAEDGEEVRFGFLQTIREYALERLNESGEYPRMQELHARYFLDLVTRCEQPLRGEDQQDAIRTIAGQVEDIRFALETSQNHSELATPGLVALSTMARYWMASGRFSDGRALLEKWLDPKKPHGLGQHLGYALACAAWFNILEGRLDAASVYAQRANAIAAKERDEWHAVYAAIAWLTTRVLSGECVVRNEVDEVCDRARALLDPWLLSHALILTAFEAFSLGDIDRTRQALEEALEADLQSGDRFSFVTDALMLARYAFTQTDPVRAASLIADAASSIEAQSNLLILAYCAETLAQIALNLGRFGPAALLFGSAKRLRADTGTASRMPTREDEVRDSIVASIGEKQYDVLWLQGYESSPEATVRAIRECATEVAAIG